MESLFVPLLFLALLVVPRVVASIVNVLPNRWHLSGRGAGRIGIAALFGFAAYDHVTDAAAISQMLPTWVPWREMIVQVTGGAQALGALGIFPQKIRRFAGKSLMALLAVLLPANIWAALHEAPVHGHENGASFLWLRVPLQLLFIGWIYWYTVRRRN